MRVFLVVVVALIVLGVRWASVGMALSAFEGDVALAPTLSTSALSAQELARDVEDAAKKREYRIVPGSLRVAVSAPEKGTLNVAGGGLAVHGPRNGQIQRVTIDARFERPTAFGWSTTDTVHVETAAPATSPTASSFP